MSDSIRSYIFILFFGFILGIGIWFLILFNIDPFKSDFLTIAAFFASFMLWFVCLFTLIGYYIRLYVTNHEVIYVSLVDSFRQAFLLGLLVDSIMIFQSMHVLTWWIGCIIGLVMLLIELFFRTRLT